MTVLAQSAANTIPVNKPSADTSRQTDLIDIAKQVLKIHEKKIRVEEDKTVYFSIIPSSSSAPDGSGRALITSTTAGIYLGSRKTTFLSSATFAPYWNFKRRFGLPLRTSVWLPDNTWNIQGDTRFLVYPQYAWGLGDQSHTHITLLDYNYLRFNQSALKKIKPYLFAGFGYALDYHFHIRPNDPATDLKQFTAYNYGLSNNSFSSGLTLNLLYDTRDNLLNPLPGVYSNIVFRINPGFLGSDNNWNSLYIDLRKYVHLTTSKNIQQNTLAFWTYLWTVFSDKAPYLDLPSTGWDPYNRSARGIDQSRYRGRSLLYLEAEYRRDLTRNGLLGFVIFSNANTVSGNDRFLTAWHPAAGAGLRVKFNKGANTNIGLDYGLSSHYSELVLNLGEAF